MRTYKIVQIVINIIGYFQGQERKPSDKLTDTAAVSLHLWLPFVPA